MAVQNLQLSDRVKVILDHRHDYYDRSQIPTRRPHYENAFRKYADQSRDIQIAMGFKSFLAEKKILICEHDILAGFAFRYTYKPSFPFDLPDDYDPLYRPPAGIDTCEEAETGIIANGFAPDSKEAEEMRTFGKCVSKWFYKHWETGHIIPGYEALINTGFGAVIEKAKAQLTVADEAQKSAIQSMLICSEAASAYIERYAEFAKSLAETVDNPDHKAHLLRMEESLRHIAHGPARTFFDAVQMIWLTHEMLYAENFPASLSFGRMDQYLFPFYEKDLKQGVMTKADTVDILDALWIKFGITLHGYQNITIGGLNQKGEYVSNDLSIMMLQSCRKTLFDQPLVCLRYHDSMPDDLWEESVALLRTGIGLPAIFIDDFCIDAKKRMGHSPEDALEYGLVGCVEMGCPGKEYGKTEALRLNTGKILEIMFFNGKSNCLGSSGIIGNAVDQNLTVIEDKEEDYTYPLFTGDRLDKVANFREMLDWYKEELKAQLNFTMTSINRLRRRAAQVLPHAVPLRANGGLHRKRQGRDRGWHQVQQLRCQPVRPAQRGRLPGRPAEAGIRGQALHPAGIPGRHEGGLRRLRGNARRHPARLPEVRQRHRLRGHHHGRARGRCRERGRWVRESAWRALADGPLLCGGSR